MQTLPPPLRSAPSPAAEFSHPDVRVVMSCLAYGLAGLRAADVAALMARLKERLGAGAGPPAEREAALEWAGLLAAARASGDAAAAAAAARVEPLELLHAGAPATIAVAHAALGRLPGAVALWLEEAFSRTAVVQPAQLGASGHDLGSGLLLGGRLGFSGTPNRLLPRALANAVVYERREEAFVLRTLTSPAWLRVETLRGWTVLRLLARAARGEAWSAWGAFSALVDVGALVTGLSNKEVAAALLCLGLQGFDGCAYLTERGEKVVLLRPRAEDAVGRSAAAAAAAASSPGRGGEGGGSSGAPEEEEGAGGLPLLAAPPDDDGEADHLGAAAAAASLPGAAASPSSSSFADVEADVPERLSDLRARRSFRALMASPPVALERCGVPLARLFAFFSQQFTTGCHVDLAPDAVAAVTVSGATTYRDFVQVCRVVMMMGGGSSTVYATYLCRAPGACAAWGAASGRPSSCCMRWGSSPRMPRRRWACAEGGLPLLPLSQPHHLSAPSRSSRGCSPTPCASSRSRRPPWRRRRSPTRGAPRRWGSSWGPLRPSGRGRVRCPVPRARTSKARQQRPRPRASSMPSAPPRRQLPAPRLFRRP